MNNTLTQPSQKTKHSRPRTILIVLVSLITALVLLDLSPFGGNYRMYTAWVQCGKKPVAAIFFAGDRFYYEPPNYSLINMFQPDKYYCSSGEAEAAGYRASLTYHNHSTESK